MKYIFVTLLIVNFAYFGYARFLQQNSPPPRVKQPQVQAPERIRLLNEVKGRGNELDQQVNRAINNAVRGDAGTDGECLAIGPLQDVFSGQALVSQLRSLDIATSVRAVDHPTGQNDYRVMIPPASSLQEAFRKLRELKSRNIDSYVITQGDDALGISLGVFANQDAADAMKQRREHEGYSVKIANIPRLDREFWVFSQNGKDLSLEPELWQTLAADHPGLKQKLMACPPSSAGIAPATGNQP